MATVAPSAIASCEGREKTTASQSPAEENDQNDGKGKADLELAANLQRRLSDIADDQQLGILSKIKKYFFNKTEPSSPLTVSPHESPKPLRKTSNPQAPIDVSALRAHQEQKDAHQEQKGVQNSNNSQSYASGGVVTERKMNYNAYFYRPETNTNKSQSSTDSKTADFSGPKQATSGTEKANRGVRHYKPKPSQLREMNFWAPTSM